MDSVVSDGTLDKLTRRALSVGEVACDNPLESRNVTQENRGDLMRTDEICSTPPSDSDNHGVKCTLQKERIQ